LGEVQKDENMKVTLENWKDAERDLKQTGIQDVVYDQNSNLQIITSKSGMRYELSSDIITQLVKSGLLAIKLGLRVRPR
jgi:hypothetical protein